MNGIGTATVIIADGLAPEGLKTLKELNGAVIEDHTALDREELKRKLPNTDILIVRSRTMVDKDLLKNPGRLKLVLRAGIGLDNIDIAAASDHGIVVMNAPTGNIVTTAEHAIAMLFAVSRHIPQADATLKSGKWEKKKFQGSEIRGKTLGVLGLGNIGRVVASRANGLEMKVLGYDPYVSAEAAAALNIRLVSMDELLRSSDYISVHVPLTSSTKNLIGRDAFEKMKKGAYLINCARGGIVDEVALVDALNAGKLSGAALDVFEVEPLPADSPLLKCSNIVVTPHLGASTDEAQTQVSIEVAEQVKQYLEAGVLKNAVNVPNISLEQLASLKPYLQLCEKLGSFVAQASPPQNIKRLCVKYSGAVSGFNREILTLSVLKGFLSPLLSTPVNFVNARKLFKERGLRVEESSEQECNDYNSVIELTVEGANTITCAGTLFGKEEPRIVRIDGFTIDVVPTGFLLLTQNIDEPGVIGSMGTVLGNHEINIARMHLGRDTKKGQAIAVINMDSEAPEKALKALRSIKGMLSVTQIQL